MLRIRIDNNGAANRQLSKVNLHLDITINESGVSAFFGKSGSGKTSLLRCLAGLEPKLQEAYIAFNGHIWHDSNKGIFLPPEKRQIAYVFQDNRLFPHLTVEQNLHFAYRRRFKNSELTIKKCIKTFQLSNMLAKYPIQLSGGEIRRAAIARALLSTPQLLILDEPTAGLDDHTARKTLDLICDLIRQIECPVLFVSHDISEVTQISNTLILMDNGQVYQHGDLLPVYKELCDRNLLEGKPSSILSAKVIGINSKHHLATTTLGDNQSLHLNSAGLALGDIVRVNIPASDVSIAISKPTNTSILNIIKTKVHKIQVLGNGVVLIHLLAGQHTILARITTKSAELLALEEQQAVYAQIKSVALLNRSVISAEHHIHTQPHPTMTS